MKEKELIIETPEQNLQEIIDIKKQPLENPVETIENEQRSSHRKAEIARANIESIAKNSDDAPVIDDLINDGKKDDDVRWTSTELLNQTYQRSMNSVRNSLQNHERNLSKVIHNPVVEKASDLASRSIARPTGILFGSVFSFVGSLFGYLLARRLGGELPYSIFAILFIGGFCLGLIFELAIYIYKIKKRK